MIYVLISYICYPLLFLITLLRRKKSISKILVIQTAKIGDLICSTPVFREIKKNYPGVRLTALVNPITKELLDYNPNVDEIITVRNEDYRGLSGKIRLSRLVRQGRYDAILCLNPNVLFALAGLWGLVPLRLSIMPNISGPTFKSASVFFTFMEDHRADRLITETYLRMTRGLGIESDDITKDVYQSPDAEIAADNVLSAHDAPRIGIAVSSGNKLKELGADKITHLVNALLDVFSFDIVLIGSIQDKGTAEKVVIGSMNRERIVNATGKMSLVQLPALLKRLDLFIGVDTGITYMADALSVPIIHLAGPVDTAELRPAGNNVRVLQYNLPCVPCTQVFNTPYECRRNDRMCIQSIDTGDVITAAKELLVHERNIYSSTG